MRRFIARGDSRHPQRAFRIVDSIRISLRGGRAVYRLSLPWCGQQRRAVLSQTEDKIRHVVDEGEGDGWE